MSAIICQLSRQRYWRWLLMLLVILMLNSCSLSRSSVPTITTLPDHTAQAIVPTALSASITAPTEMARSNPPTEPFVLTRKSQDVYLEALAGNIVIIDWISTTQLLAFWSQIANAEENAIYLVDIDTGQLRQLVTNRGRPKVIWQPDRSHAVFLWESTMDVAVFDKRSGMLQTVLSRDPKELQWTMEPDTRSDFGDVSMSLGITWGVTDTFVLTLTPQDRNAPDWGKVLLVDVAAQRVHVVAKEGQLAAILSDGSLLVRHGWVDGDIVLFAPPDYKSPLTVAPGGLWTWGWTISLNEQQVAWLEWTPPTGDWTHRLPQSCCSSEPHPTIHALVIWDRTNGKVQHFPITGLRWPDDLHLRWRKSGAAILFTGVPPAHPNYTALFQLTLNGQSTMLASHEWLGNLNLNFETTDGSIYYVVTGRRGQNDSQLMRRALDGKLETLCDGIPLNCSIDEQGKLITKMDDAITIQDVETGVVRRLAIPSGAEISPEGRWIIDGNPGPKIHLMNEMTHL